jgi:hypothetical protein
MANDPNSKRIRFRLKGKDAKTDNERPHAATASDAGTKVKQRYRMTDPKNGKFKLKGKYRFRE